MMRIVFIAGLLLGAIASAERPFSAAIGKGAGL